MSHIRLLRRSQNQKNELHPLEPLHYQSSPFLFGWNMALASYWFSFIAPPFFMVHTTQQIFWSLQRVVFLFLIKSIMFLNNQQGPVDTSGHLEPLINVASFTHFTSKYACSIHISLHPLLDLRACNYTSSQVQ